MARHPFLLLSLPGNRLRNNPPQRTRFIYVSANARTLIEPRGQVTFGTLHARSPNRRESPEVRFRLVLDSRQRAREPSRAPEGALRGHAEAAARRLRGAGPARLLGIRVKCAVAHRASVPDLFMSVPTLAP